jgi:hypothetical protein
VDAKEREENYLNSTACMRVFSSSFYVLGNLIIRDNLDGGGGDRALTGDGCALGRIEFLRESGGALSDERREIFN